MKKWILLALAVAASWFVYVKFVRAGPEKAFEEFATLWGTNRLDEAWAFTVREEIQPDIDGNSVNDVTSHMMENIMGVTYAQTSLNETDDAVEITGVLAVLFTPPGVTSAMMPSHRAGIAVEGTVRKTAQGWKVTGFSPELKGIQAMERPR